MCAFRSSQKKFGESLPSQIKTHPPPLISDERAIHVKIDMVPQIKTRTSAAILYVARLLFVSR
ncbi:hypothetical protein NC651_015018 [Populus alba x Populus x berolinensis]|nr:hypothetical protein NC651_015018 [Populus alba x Populus x berolinensis]